MGPAMFARMASPGKYKAQHLQAKTAGYTALHMTPKAPSGVRRVSPLHMMPKEPSNTKWLSALAGSAMAVSLVAAMAEDGQTYIQPAQATFRTNVATEAGAAAQQLSRAATTIAARNAALDAARSLERKAAEELRAAEAIFPTSALGAGRESLAKERPGKVAPARRTAKGHKARTPKARRLQRLSFESPRPIAAKLRAKALVVHGAQSTRHKHHLRHRRPLLVSFSAGTSTTTTTATTTTTSATRAPVVTPPMAPPTTGQPVPLGHPTTTTSPATTATTAPPTTAPPTTTAPASSGAAPQGTVSSFWPSSIFNQDVESWPVDPNSSEFVNDIVSDYKADYGAVGVNSMPIYSVPADQPDATISLQAGCQPEFLSEMGTSVPIPPYAVLSSSSDSPLVIYQPSTGTDWELWQVTRQSSTSYTACWGGKLQFSTSDGVFPKGFSLSASGISYLATTITEADVQSGSINHAIALTIPPCDSYVYPATDGDCPGVAGQPNEGQWFRLSSSVNCAGYDDTPFEEMVCKALQTYGMVVLDQGGAVMLEAEQTADWAASGNSGTDPITASWEGQQEYQVVANLPWQDLQVVDPPQ